MRAVVLSAAVVAVSAQVGVQSNGAQNFYPVAAHRVLHASPGVDVEFSLPGYDSDGDVLTTRIESLPTSGALYQLSHNYDRHGGTHSKRGSRITSVPSVVTGSGARLLYAPPEDARAPESAWDFFEYTVDDGSLSTNTGTRTSVSPRGTVAVVAEEKTLVASTFSSSAEGWTVSHNGQGGVGVSYEASSRGMLNHYIFSTDDEIMKDSAGSDAERWRFVAPSKFLSPTVVMAYGGSLRFWASSASGDFSAPNLNANRQLVRLTCSQCNDGRGVTMAHFPSAETDFAGSQKHISIPLRPTAWLKDSQNPLKPWTAPTECELVAVLASLDSVEVFGDHTSWYESMAIDSVELVAGSSGDIPLKCYDLEHGTSPRP